jgi:hypothetical protein
MSAVETQFRKSERDLDAAIRAAAPLLERLGLSIEDRSVRSYHYKADHLAWLQVVQRRWELDLETILVQVFLTHMEPTSAGERVDVGLATRVQRFRPGQESSLDKRSQTSVPLSELLRVGIGPTIAEKLREAAASAGQAL